MNPIVHIFILPTLYIQFEFAALVTLHFLRSRLS